MNFILELFFLCSDKSKRITKIGAKTASTLKSALGKANGKAKGKQCLREVAAARIAEISAMFEQQATDLAAGNITVRSNTKLNSYS